MYKLTNIISEILNTYSIEADLFTNPDFNVTDILNQIRAVRKVTIVTIITPDNYFFLLSFFIAFSCSL